MEKNIMLKFLEQLAASNNREWFNEHKDQYQAARAEFDRIIDRTIEVIGTFDPTVSHLKAKDCVFRIYRDTRFSKDKSPYKNHFGAYISSHGRQALHGGYYIHVQPGRCLIGAGVYWLPTNILTSVRNEIMGNIDEWLKCVENGEFVKNFGYANDSEWTEEHTAPKGFGMQHLKKAPKDFPADYEHVRYLKMKDYCVWQVVADDFYNSADWTKKMVKLLKVAKPMMDFTNSVIDDYE